MIGLIATVRIFLPYQPQSVDIAGLVALTVGLDENLAEGCVWVDYVVSLGVI